MKIIDERKKQKTKTDRNNVVAQAIVKVEELICKASFQFKFRARFINYFKRKRIILSLSFIIFIISDTNYGHLLLS